MVRQYEQAIRWNEIEDDWEWYLLTEEDLASMKKKSALEKARSQMKKAEHVHTPQSIKRKLKKPIKEKKS